MVIYKKIIYLVKHLIHWACYAGDLTVRLCTAAEIKFYFSSFVRRDEATTVHVKPNVNCNLAKWVSGCEPGWSCNADDDKRFDLNNGKILPSRTRKCQPCCEGFFCPQGLACMIRKKSINIHMIIPTFWNTKTLI